MNISGFKVARFLPNFAQTVDYLHACDFFSPFFLFVALFSRFSCDTSYYILLLLFMNRTNIEGVENALGILLIEMTALQIRGYIEAVLCDMIKKGLVIMAALRIDQ